jgi:tetratricopeptide (TPR) repeat protein
LRFVFRIVASALIAAAAVFLLARLWQHQECNVQEEEARRRVEVLTLHPEQISSRIAARELLERMSDCSRKLPADVSELMLRAALLQILGRTTDAIAVYRQALKLDRRSELYMDLAEAEAEAGHQTEAVDAFTLAALTNWPFFSETPEPERDMVGDIIIPLRKTLFAKGPHPQALDRLHDRIVTLSE